MHRLKKSNLLVILTGYFIKQWAMKEKELNEKVALLKAGQVVEIYGLMVSAKEWVGDEGEFPCPLCSLNKSCSLDFTKVCSELDITSDSVWYLQLESEKRNMYEQERNIRKGRAVNERPTSRS